ncbi:sensor histidine kinase [Streptomyces sp. NPDC058257]|uniref:sensor histidine kinase n=1 Tax=Streptomyces sp. NPDC058257 TaxID=3346409 RepID=UPI0036EF5FC5
MRAKTSRAGVARGALRSRLARRPETPVAAAALLALGAVSEVLLRTDGDVPLPLALSLALGTTLPVAVLAGGDFATASASASASASSARPGSVRPIGVRWGGARWGGSRWGGAHRGGVRLSSERWSGERWSALRRSRSVGQASWLPNPADRTRSFASASPGPSRGVFATAAVLAGVAGMLSLAPFHVLTVVGLCALLVSLHQAGRRGLKHLAAILPLPFIAYAATTASTGAGAGDRPLTVLTAVGAAVAAGTGLARSARDTARVHSAAEQAIADTLLEHAARGERARIARELHDVVAHHISMIAVQAETARLTTPGLPSVGAERFLAIGDTARTALTEMRRLLGVLREDAGAAAPDRRPQPGLEQLGELVDEARDASAAAVRLIVEGPVRPLDPGLELTAYRIVQEALTNTRRHAPGAAVDVELHYTHETLRLRVRDNGPSPHTPAGLDEGHGLVGMRERAAMVGGELRAGPARRGGFLIEASFPAPVREHAA